MFNHIIKIEIYTFNNLLIIIMVIQITNTLNDLILSDKTNITVSLSIVHTKT